MSELINQYVGCKRNSVILNNIADDLNEFFYDRVKVLDGYLLTKCVTEKTKVARSRMFCVGTRFARRVSGCVLRRENIILVG